ncbi:MAG: hypothetical protein ACW981_03275 [Candidatus Hodarchaeales archaeon]|jgi:cytoskeletal protein CcmA (bactofilin family)
MSEDVKRNLRGKFGPTELNESGEYGYIKSNGPFTANESFSVDDLKVNGPATANFDAKIENGKINGPASFNGNLVVNSFLKVNGPLDIDGNLDIFGDAKVNGPVEADNVSSSNKEGTISINGPIETSSITGLDKVLIRGVLKTNLVDSVSSLKVSGRVKTETIKVKELKILLQNKRTVIDKIEAEFVEIGTEIDDDELYFSKVGVFDRLIKRVMSREPGYAEIDEIRSTGVVELDHVKVNKVYARELLVGEETEVGEFIDLSKVQ